MPILPSATDDIPEESLVVEDDQYEQDYEDTQLDESEDIPMFDEDGEPILRTRDEIDVLLKGDDAPATMATRGLAIKPFAGTVQVFPTDAPKTDRSKPDEGLQLDWVHGYRCHDSRSNIAVNSEGHIVYPAAGLVVTLDTETREQKFFRHHDDDVLCLAQNPVDPDVVVTGQIATIENGRSKAPAFCVHNTVTGEYHRVEDAAERAVRCVAVSCDGSLIATAGCDDKFTVTVWDYRTLRKVCSAPSAANKPLKALAFSPTHPCELVSVGSGHAMLWTVDMQAGKLSGKSCLKNMPKQLYTCAAFTGTGNQVLVGARDGGVYVLVRGQAKGVFRVHEGTVNTVSAAGSRFVTGGDDGRVCVLDRELRPLWQAQFASPVRSAVMDDHGNLTVGTRGGQLWEIPAEVVAREGVCVGEAALGEPAVEGHSDGEVWAVAPHPDGLRYATAGEDNSLYLWDSVEHRCVARGVLDPERGIMPRVSHAATTSRSPVNQRARAAAFSPDGKFLAVGGNDGRVSVFCGSTLKPLHRVDLNKYGKRKISGQYQNWIEALSFSPSGRTLAVATHGICICLLNVAQNFAVQEALKEHTAAVTSLDWAADGRHLRSISLSCELLFHSIDEEKLSRSKHQPSAPMVRDVRWATTTGKFDWSLMGLWRKADGNEAIDFSHINGVDVSPDMSLVATGSDEGVVSLARWPAAKDKFTDKPKQDMRVYQGHSSHIPRVKFDTSGRFLYSTGGEDKCVFQWKVVKAGV